MSGRRKAFRWFWLIMLSSGFLLFLFRNVEPLKTKQYSAPWYLLMLVFLISGAVWFTIAFREGKVIRREITAKRKDIEEKYMATTYDIGTKLGRELRKGLEESLGRHAIAGVISMGCGLLPILLKSPWYMIIITVFISFQIADYALFKLFKKVKMG